MLAALASPKLKATLGIQYIYTTVIQAHRQFDNQVLGDIMGQPPASTCHPHGTSIQLLWPRMLIERHQQVAVCISLRRDRRAFLKFLLLPGKGADVTTRLDQDWN